MICKNNYKGFTLAETLITLGIIGVIAALTIPGLITAHHKRVIETKLEKTYSTILQGFKMAQYENGDITVENPRYEDADVNGYSWQLSKDIFDKYFIQVFKVSTEYPKSKNTEFNNLYSADGTKKLSDMNSYTVYAQLNDGTLIGFTKAGNYSGCIFDIILNPNKNRWKSGADHFQMIFQSDGYGNYSYKSLASQKYNNSTRSKFLTYCKSQTKYPAYAALTSDFCTVLIIKNNFKIPSDYPVKI